MEGGGRVVMSGWWNRFTKYSTDSGCTTGIGGAEARALTLWA